VRKLLRILIAAVVATAGVVYLLVYWPMRDPHPAARPAHGVLTIRDVKIYPAPDVAPIEDGVIVVRDGRIAAFGRDVQAPADTQILRCDRCVVTAGFWNAHVHFTEPKWSFAAWQGAAALNRQLADMLTSRGFTTVVDTGSDLRETLSLRRRIGSGELKGPAIYTAGSGIYPPHGIPYYLKNSLPFFLLWFMPQPASPQDAARVEERNIANGADILKLFTGSYVERGRVLPMPVEIARAAVEVAHRHGQLAFSHPSNLAGTKVAMDAGVDVLAHAPDSTEGVDAALLSEIVARHMAMIPTLKMFATTVTKDPAYLQPIYAEVRQFHGLGGELMFGTDVGYMSDYATADEFRALGECGLNAMDVLRMLTVAPAGRFGVSAEKGTIAAGKVADLTVLSDDPARDVAAFARVRFTIRNGEVIYSRP